MLRIGRTLKSKYASRASAITVTGTVATIYFVSNKGGTSTKAENRAPSAVSTPRKNEIPTRASQISDLSSGKQVFDVLVIGGGATGAGAALDAATRGLSTALIEKGDFGNETSSRST